MVRRQWFAAASRCCLGVLMAAVAMLGERSAQAEPIYNAGHADIGSTYDGANSFEVHFNFDVGATYEPPHSGTGQFHQDFGPGGQRVQIAPTDAFVRVRDDSPPITYSMLPPAFAAYTGVQPGGTLWYLPATNDPTKPFFGFSSEDLDPSDWVGSLRWELTNVVSAPAGGEASAWANGAFGAIIPKYTTADGDTSNDSFLSIVGSHEHFNFGFTQPGVYQLELTASGQHITNGLVSGSGVFTFLVGDNTTAPVSAAVPEPSSCLVMLLVGSVTTLAWRFVRRRVGRTA